MSGSASILVLDDETAITALVQSVLTRMGYEVCEADTGAKALEIFRERLEHGTPFDLVILDLRPGDGMSGSEVLAQMRALAPGTKALAASGSFIGDEVPDEGTEEFSAFLGKPFHVNELREAVDSLLGHGGTAAASQSGG